MAKKSNKALVISLIAEADVVANEHEIYHEQYVTRANETLYKLLANMLKVCLEVEASGEAVRVVKEMRSKLLAEHGLKTQANSRTSAIVVRYIVRSGRKTAHVYGRVIDVAIANNITPEQLPDFIRERGGIEEIRLSVVATDEKKTYDDLWNKARISVTKMIHERKPIGKVVLDSEARLPIASDVEFSYLICNRNLKTGDIDVLGSLYPSSDIEKRALHLYATTSLVMQHNGRNSFYEYCDMYGLNQDLVHDWMKSNGFGEEENAKEFSRELIKATKELQKKESNDE